MLILVACMYALAAASFTIAKAALMYAQPLFFLAVRMSVAGIGILSYHRLAYGHFPRVKREDVGLFVLVAFVHIYLTFVLDLIALQFMGSAKAAFIYNLSPFIASFFSYYFFKERLTPKKIIGLLIGLLGFVPELLINAPAEKISGMVAWFSGAELMMIGSVAASQLGWTLVRILVKRSYSIPSINGYAMLAGGVLSAITSFFFEYHPLHVKAWHPFIALTALIILVSNVLMYGIGTYLFRHYTVTFLSFAGFTTPLFAALFGKIFLGESVGIHFFFSLAVVSLGLWIFYGEEIKQGYIID